MLRIIPSGLSSQAVYGSTPGGKIDEGANPGVSSHTPNLERGMRRAVDSGSFRLLLVAYDFRTGPT
jgi:hypothetical protein